MAASTTVYFDTTDATICLPLLPVALQTTVDLLRLAAECEADILNHFTKPINRVTYLNYPAPAQLPVALQLTSVFTNLGNGLGVFLAGYTLDPSQCADPIFVMAVRRTVALVFQWRYPQGQRDVQVKQMSGASGSLPAGQKTWSSFESLPPAWARYLKAYDTREGEWGI